MTRWTRVGGINTAWCCSRATQRSNREPNDRSTCMDETSELTSLEEAEEAFTNQFNEDCDLDRYDLQAALEKIAADYDGDADSIRSEAMVLADRVNTHGPAALYDEEVRT